MGKSLAGFLTASALGGTQEYNRYKAQESAWRLDQAQKNADAERIDHYNTLSQKRGQQISQENYKYQKQTDAEMKPAFVGPDGVEITADKYSTLPDEAKSTYKPKREADLEWDIDKATKVAEAGQRVQDLAKKKSKEEAFAAIDSSPLPEQVKDMFKFQLETGINVSKFLGDNPESRPEDVSRIINESRAEAVKMAEAQGFDTASEKGRADYNDFVKAKASKFAKDGIALYRDSLGKTKSPFEAQEQTGVLGGSTPSASATGVLGPEMPPADPNTGLNVKQQGALNKTVQDVNAGKVTLAELKKDMPSETYKTVAKQVLQAREKTLMDKYNSTGKDLSRTEKKRLKSIRKELGRL